MSSWHVVWVSEAPDVEEPDWSRVPEHKREEVRCRFRERHENESPWIMWGPQLEHYRRMDKRLTDMGPVDEYVYSMTNP